MAIMQMKRLAIVVGINNYPPPQSRLRGCVPDAQRFAAFLHSARGGSFDHVVLLKDGAATLAKLRQVFRLASSGLWEQVVFYFSGHGSSQGILAWDGLMDFEELALSIRHLRAQWPLLVLDACQSGAVHHHFDGLGGIPAPYDPARIYLDALRRAHPGLRVLTAVDRQTLAMERNAQGVFTTALLKAARMTSPDLDTHVVSAARVFSAAYDSLWDDGEALPQSSGSLEDFPMALSDTVLPLGGAEFLQQPMRVVNQPGSPLSSRFEYTVRLMGRRQLPTAVLHRVYDGAVWRDTAASMQLLPRTNDEVYRRVVVLPLHPLRLGHELHSVVTVVDERGQCVAQNQMEYPALRLVRLTPPRPVAAILPRPRTPPKPVAVILPR